MENLSTNRAIICRIFFFYCLEPPIPPFSLPGSYMYLHLQFYAKVDPAPAYRARAPPFEIFYRFIFENFKCRTRINFIVINMQCLRCVFYSLISLQKYMVCEEGHQNNIQTSSIIPRRDRNTPPPPPSKTPT